MDERGAQGEPNFRGKTNNSLNKSSDRQPEQHSTSSSTGLTLEIYKIAEDLREFEKGKLSEVGTFISWLKQEDKVEKAKLKAKYVKKLASFERKFKKDLSAYTSRLDAVFRKKLQKIRAVKKAEVAKKIEDHLKELESELFGE